MRQERAEQTRQRLIDAAAREFAERGYAGSTLQAVVREAGGTMGGLTFHFPSKSALAAAVQQAGAAATAEVIGRERPVGLQGVLCTTLTLAEAIETTPSMRAAARFAREGVEGASDGHDWYASWVPGLRDELERVWREERVQSTLTPAAVAALLSHLVIGVEAAAASKGTLASRTGSDPHSALRQLARTLVTLVSS